MDGMWADGWRHFGSHFFRDQYNVEGVRLVRVIPLRIQIKEFMPSKSQRKLIRKNQDFRVEFKQTQLTEHHHQLFKQHRNRFKKNKPSKLHDFISPRVNLNPCQTMMCNIWDQDKLVATSFLDIGHQAASSVYAMFDLEYSNRRLGIYTLLLEMLYAQEMGLSYLYTGYAHTKPSFYEYKKQFLATEFYNWKGQWLPLEELEAYTFPQHRYEIEDIPQEFLVEDEEGDEE